MELIKIEQNKKEVTLVLKVGEVKDYTEIEQIRPGLNQINHMIFKNKEDCEKYFTALCKHNEDVIADNEKRLAQIDVDSLEKINNFIDVIKKSKALGKRKSEKIEGLIAAHENMESFKYNIKLTKERNKINEEILEEIKKLK